MKIQIVVFDGFGKLVSFAPFEVLKRAIEEGARFMVELVSSEPKQEVTTSFGVTVKLHDFLRMDNRPDLLIVPGGGWNHKAEHGARKQAEIGTLTKMIREMQNEGTIVAGVCTGGMLLAASGILNDKKEQCIIWRRVKLVNMGQNFFITELWFKAILLLQEELLQELI